MPRRKRGDVIGKTIESGIGYMSRGKFDWSGPVDSLGYKMAKVGRYGQLIVGGANLGKKAIGSFFSQKEKTMAPAKFKRRKASATTRKAASNVVVKYVQGTAKKAVRKTPPMTKEIVKYVPQAIRKRKYRYTSSKSGGFFPSPEKRLTPFDEFGTKGVIMCRETGGVMKGTIGQPFLSVGLSHATTGINQLLYDACIGIVKMLAIKNKYPVENLGDRFSNSGRNYRLYVDYKLHPTLATANHNLLIVQTDSALNVADAIYNAIVLQVNQHPQFKLIAMSLYEATSGTVLENRVFKVDMKKAEMEYYAKSTMKMQNRTVEADEDDEDDVDNAPLYGKFYEGSGNYFHVNDTYFAPLPLASQSNGNQYGFLVNATLAEPQPLSAIKRAEKTGKAHLDPGQIKTSVLTTKFKYNLNFVLNRISQNSTDSNCMALGEFRFFHLEKMITAVGSTAANQIQIAYEIDLKTGVIITSPIETITTMPLLTNVINP